MRRKLLSVEQSRLGWGVPVAEVIRKAGISEQTFYRCKALGASRPNRMSVLHLAGHSGKQILHGGDARRAESRAVCDQNGQGHESFRRAMIAPFLIGHWVPYSSSISHRRKAGTEKNWVK
jgi:hypothetical protein